MTGLNLETFLHLLRADFGAWATLGLIGLVLVLMAWTSWGSRRALRKCLVLSVLAHFGLALYGGTMPVVLLSLQPDGGAEAARARIKQIKVTPVETAEANSEPGRPGGAGGFAPWDRPGGGLSLTDARLSAPRTVAAAVVVRPGDRASLAAEGAAPEAPEPAPTAPEARPAEAAPAKDEAAAMPPRVSPGGEDEVAPAVVASRADAGPPARSTPDARLRPGRPEPAEAGMTTAPRLPAAAAALPDPPSLFDAPEPAPEAGIGTARAAPSEAAGEPAPPAAAELAARDVAAADVTPARPDSPRLSAGEANLRSRSRPGRDAGAGAAAPPRPPLAVAMRASPAPERAPDAGAAAGPPDAPALAVRPAGVGDGVGVDPPGRKPASAEGEVAAPEVVKQTVAARPELAPPESDVRRRSRPGVRPGEAATAARRSTPAGPLALARVTPNGIPAPPEIQGATGGRPLADVPEVYRSRLDPNRSARAFRSGASPESEQAVERALDWLARHQDIDGRWDGATAKYDDGTAVKGDDDFTVHCPPGETCFGECVYWEADTALTGLALLSYLGAGYTQTDGKYAETVGKGIDFLLSSQKPDGDLRGRSRAVGMYCHAMATIALCEAYALTGDERLRAPVGRAVKFITRARARDGLSWRYSPDAPVGDTSILGWVVMALKSAREVGIPVPGDVQSGTIGWLDKVSSGGERGLARYQPQDNVTPTMTAEAWVCRQFLGVGGPGPASTEAADYLLAHGPNSDQYNLYYWYYGTLAMYQHGGDAWYRWNAQARDEIVRRQRAVGHPAGSWDPDDSPYGAKGGRIYCTALAALSLEVYYRYLRLYDDPKIPPAVAPARPRALGRAPSGPKR